MSTRSTLMFVNDGRVHVFTEAFDDDDTKVRVEIDAPVTFGGAVTVEVVVDRNEWAEQCRRFLAAHEQWAAWAKARGGA